MESIFILNNRWEYLIKENYYSINYSAEIEFTVKDAMNFSDDELNIFKWMKINNFRTCL